MQFSANPRSGACCCPGRRLLCLWCLSMPMIPLWWLLLLMPSRPFFESYAVFALGSGSRLKQVKSKGLWLGSWCGRVDTPVRLYWTSVTLNILGISFGSGNVEEMNWRPRIVAVKNVLNSWRQRALSSRGNAVIVNALALARIWYVAGLIHLPA